MKNFLMFHISNSKSLSLFVSSVTMSPAPPLSHFPDLCIFNIFHHLPLIDLIHVGPVCKNWMALQRFEVKYHRPSLVITQYEGEARELELLHEQQNPQYGNNLLEHVHREVDGSPWVKFCSNDQILLFNAINCPNHVLQDSFIFPLSCKLTNITDLTLFQLNLPDLQAANALHQMSRLTSHWSKTLVSLNVHFSFHGACPFGTIFYDQVTESTIRQGVDQLFRSINQIKSLRTLLLNATFYGLILMTSTQLTFLSHLELFVVEKIDNTLWMLQSICESPAEGNPNLQIACGELITFEQLFGRLNLRVSSKFVRLNLSDRLIVSDYKHLQRFSTRFRSLISLTLYSMKMPMTMIIRCLSQLTELVYLKVKFEKIVQEQVPINEERDNNGDEEGENGAFQFLPHILEDLPLQFIPDPVPIPSVRLLSLEIVTYSHYDTMLLYPVEHFPNLQVLDLKHAITSCDECGITTNHVNQALNGQSDYALELCVRIENCLGRSREPFRFCDNLHTVNISNMQKFLPQGLISVDEI